MKSIICTIALLLTTFWLHASPTNGAHLTSGQLPIAELLNPDGTLNLTTGFTGSLNLAGFDVRMDECEGIVAASTKITGPQAGEDAPALPLNTWSVLGGELNHNVQVIAVHGPYVYAGGFFTEAGGTPANYIAKWDGSNWTALGDGLNNHCYAIAVSALNGDVYVGGLFTTAGGVDASRIAKWNGSTWSALGAELTWYNNPASTAIICRAIAISGNDIYIGGLFTHAGGVSFYNIAKWDGTNWTALGTGLNNSCVSIAISGSDVYVGGNFTQASGVSARNIAKWNGTSWSALGSGLNAQCMGIAFSGSDVYVVGTFTTAGDIPASRIAKWDGSSWSALGSGLNGSTHAVAVGSNVYAGNPSATSTSNAPDPANSVIKWEAEPISELDQNCITCQEGLTLLKDNMYKYPEKANEANNGKLPWTEVYADFRDNYLPACNEVGTFVKANNTPAMSSIYQTATVDNWDKLFQSHVGILTHASRIPAYCPNAHRGQYDCVEASRRMLQYSIPAVESIINLVK